ncbi:DNA-3-methyladenine glycosylase [Dyadobacter frigoris]|uniref:Putative 3-methyladenine DNA glycosylase n=1 Tax=Dyadobacter frigoris TaxID=2576211 RepID=A0A4U6CVJ6_9BACT|nr:DNA-3-methyladenine glycosylase [Dyadobacter frigoris]TKT88692.1 DNA-3-methyladenine glycosylase [Dyadobacter frigoris]GLU53877.1 putative 3-methyladenine DNA glycosylase [Dyadobacter frigoris]
MIPGENRLPISFYEAYDTRTLAQKLLGCELVHNSPDGITSGIIVETEAYLQDDPACHAYQKRTARTEPMYAAAGTIYVYLIYGMYQCVNVVSNKPGCGEAVLIRALEPVKGIELMEMRREISRNKKSGVLKKPISTKELCRGPGKLVQAMGIDKSVHNAQSLIESNLYITPSASCNPFEIEISKRIGITQGADFLYRYSIKNNPFVSK